MLSRLGNIFRVPDLRNKVLFTLLIIALYQVGANVPVPGVSWSQLQKLQAEAGSSGVLGFLNLFSGGALVRLAVFGLGIMPYITSSIIIQLLTTVIPKLEEWRDQGAVGQKKITQTTRYLTIALALMQSTGLVYAFHGHDAALLGTNIDLIPKFTIQLGAFMVLILTAGTAFVMWLAELITQRGIGQGMSILIFANVVASIPSGGKAIYEEGGAVKFTVMLLVSLLLLVVIVFMDQGQRRIPVTFAKRVVGRRMYGGQSTYIPLKVNQSGVIPIIFASSVLYIPVLLSNVIPWQSFQSFVKNNIQPTSLIYIFLYFVLIVVFTFFYVYVAFDPHQQADIIRKQGGFIPGIRPGPPTERYFAHILNRITVPGALFLASVAVVPSILMALWNINKFPFFGTTLLISVGVALDNDEADRQPADDAQLRGLPQVGWWYPASGSWSSASRGPARGRSACACRTTSSCPMSPPATCCGPRSSLRTPLGQRAKALMDQGELIPDDLVMEMVGQRLDRRRHASPRLHPRRLPADRSPRPRTSPSCSSPTCSTSCSTSRCRRRWCSSAWRRAGSASTAGRTTP